MANYKYYSLRKDYYYTNSTNALISNYYTAPLITNYYFTNTIVTNLRDGITNTSVFSSSLNAFIQGHWFYFYQSIGNNTLIGYSNHILTFHRINQHLEFYSNGQVKSGLFNNDTVIIDSVYYITSHQSSPPIYAYFYQNGKLKQAALLSPTSFHGIEYEWYSLILFFEDGKVKQGKINTNSTINGNSYSAGTYLRFNANGTVHSSGNSWDANY